MIYTWGGGIAVVWPPGEKRRRTKEKKTNFPLWSERPDPSSGGQFLAAANTVWTFRAFTSVTSSPEMIQEGSVLPVQQKCLFEKHLTFRNAVYFHINISNFDDFDVQFYHGLDLFGSFGFHQVCRQYVTSINYSLNSWKTRKEKNLPLVFARPSQQESTNFRFLSFQIASEFENSVSFNRSNVFSPCFTDE